MASWACTCRCWCKLQLSRCVLAACAVDGAREWMGCSEWGPVCTRGLFACLRQRLVCSRGLFACLLHSQQVATGPLPAGASVVGLQERGKFKACRPKIHDSRFHLQQQTVLQTWRTQKGAAARAPEKPTHSASSRVSLPLRPPPPAPAYDTYRRRPAQQGPASEAAVKSRRGPPPWRTCCTCIARSLRLRRTRYTSITYLATWDLGHRPKTKKEGRKE